MMDYIVKYKWGGGNTLSINDLEINDSLFIKSRFTNTVHKVVICSIIGNMITLISKIDSSIYRYNNRTLLDNLSLNNRYSGFEKFKSNLYEIY